MKINRGMGLALALTGALVFTGCSAKGEAAKGEGGIPDKKVTVIVPAAAGAALDVRARVLMSQFVEGKIGQSVVIDDQGAAGPTEFVLHNDNDYTLYVASTSALTSNLLFTQSNYTEEDMIPLATIDREEFGLFVCPDRTGITEIGDLRERGGTIKYATGKVGSLGHIACFTAFDQLGIPAEHVVTTGASVSLTECLGGHNDICFAGLELARQYVEEGNLVPVLTFNEDDYQGYEGITVPSLKTLGGDYSVASVVAVFARKDVPEDTRRYLTDVILETLEETECREALKQAGVVNLYHISGEELDDYIAEEKENYKEVGVKAGLTLVGQ